MSEPLAARMRPESLSEVIGQEHILGQGKLLRRVIEADRITNLIFYGPPGCGKTTLAEVIANTTQRQFVRLSGVLSGVADIRRICDNARNDLNGKGTILFIDEIHRFNKSQQDVLLPYVEDGTVVLIGATTHNPNFFINTPLTSRSLVFELKPLNETQIEEVLKRALTDTEKGYGQLPIILDDAASQFLASVSNGDARHALTALEIAILSTPPDDHGKIYLSVEIIQDCVQKRKVSYDKTEDGHYDTISAFIKSIRGSDPNAAVYWLGKMLEAGEDPRFIARRLIISASEDIGNADPRGLTVAVAAMQAAEFVGMPECRYNLAQATTYLATAPKSNASCLAIDEALADVRTNAVQPVPEHLKNKHVKAIGSNKVTEYLYPHNFMNHYVEQAYLSIPKTYYRPTKQGYEATIAQRINLLKAKLT